ncbi:MAG: hypothetical protein LBN26_07275 [Christensenellaceae bacterium]|jgi:spore maturation protein SpmB|nr:hypothetical protein [Christensenellaceae bacterium]
MKKYIIFALCALACVLLALHSAAALQAAREGILLWRDSILPALLPFFVCAYIMQSCGALPAKSRSYLYALCLVSGAPAGARLAGSAERDETRLVAALNVVSPMFICGAFAANMLGQPKLAPPILIGQLFGALTLLLLARPAPIGKEPRPPTDPPPALRLMSDGLREGMAALLSIGATIVFFAAMLALLEETGALRALTQPVSRCFALLGLDAQVPRILFMGLLEVVSGCQAIAESTLPLRQAAALGAFFFSFGGLCVFAQSLAFARLSMGRYFKLKLLQGALAGGLTYLLTPLFLPQAQAVFTPLQPVQLLRNAVSAALTAGISLLSVSVVFLFAAAAGHAKRGQEKSGG